MADVKRVESSLALPSLGFGEMNMFWFMGINGRSLSTKVTWVKLISTIITWEEKRKAVIQKMNILLFLNKYLRTQWRWERLKYQVGADRMSLQTLTLNLTVA